jgi:hypothetical protein
MGVDIVQLGNHSIKFDGKSFSELINEIIPILEKINIENIEYLRFALLDYYDGKDWLKGECEWIKNKNEWTYREEDKYYNFFESKSIEIYGPGGLEFTIYENYIYFANPPYRYNLWFYYLDKIHRDEWRKYMYKVIIAFGGDKVIYLPDNMMDSSEYYQNSDEMSFEQITNGLIKDYGKNTKELDEINENDEIDYYLDDFKTIDWSKSAPIESIFGE